MFEKKLSKVAKLHAVIAVMLKNKAVKTVLLSELWIAMMLALTNLNVF